MLVKAVEKLVRRPLRVLWRGLDWPTMLHLLECCITYARRKFGIRLKSKLLPRTIRRAKSIDAVWQALVLPSPHCVALISIEGFFAHWTVVYAVTEQTLRLFDSAGRKTLRKRNCSITARRKRFRLDPTAMLFVERLV
jgi:hypothetical protein